MDLEEYLNCHLKFCPECGKQLEINPNTEAPACFLHGDFNTRGDNIVWKFTDPRLFPRR